MPYMMHFPGRIQAGQVYHEPVSTLDILPTAAAACEVFTSHTQPLVGVNLLPYLRGDKTGAPHEVLYWKLAAYSAIRVGSWKLYLEPKNGIAKLFHLKADLGGKLDLKTPQPEELADLLAHGQEWDKSLPPRAWINISPVFKK